MAISFNPLTNVARAYERPKIIPTRADVNNQATKARTAVDNRRENPAVQFRLSAEALDVLARGRRDAPSQTQLLGQGKTTNAPSKNTFSLADFLAGTRFDDHRKPADPAPDPESVKPAYAPPGSHINILL